MRTLEQTRRRARTIGAVALAALAALGAPALEQSVGHAATSTVGTWERTGPLTVARYDHTTTLLANGRVLAAGGRTQGVTPPANFNTAEVYDPIAEQWSPTGSLNEYRWRHTATLLPDGRVLVAGGFGGSPVGLTTNAQPVLDSAEVYDPATGTWTPTASMTTRRALHVASLLPDGKVLVAGGRTCDQPPPTACAAAGFVTNTAEVYDPATGQWTPTGSMIQTHHTTNAARLANGTVLVPGGFTTGSPNAVELYDPATGTWRRTGDMNAARARSGTWLLQDGRVLVALGFPANQTTETYDPATEVWTPQGLLPQFPSRFNYSWGVMPNGKAILAGGQTFPPSAVVTNSDLFEPSTGQWTPTGPMNDPHGSGSSLSNSDPMVILSASPTSYVADPAVCGRHCGKAMVAGNSPTGSVELFTAPNTCFGFNATIIGTEGPDTLSGTRGRDVIIGLGGDDRISAGAGEDIVCGGIGNDSISGGFGNDVVLGEFGLDSVAGTEGDDYLFGEEDGDRLTGDSGTDTADGGQFDGPDVCFAEAVRNCGTAPIP